MSPVRSEHPYSRSSEPGGERQNLRPSRPLPLLRLEIDSVLARRGRASGGSRLDTRESRPPVPPSVYTFDGCLVAGKLRLCKSVSSAGNPSALTGDRCRERGGKGPLVTTGTSPPQYFSSHARIMYEAHTKGRYIPGRPRGALTAICRARVAGLQSAGFGKFAGFGCDDCLAWFSVFAFRKMPPPPKRCLASPNSLALPATTRPRLRANSKIWDPNASPCRPWGTGLCSSGAVSPCDCGTVQSGSTVPSPEGVIPPNGHASLR